MRRVLTTFVHETRVLYRYRYLVDGSPVTPVALSNIDQHRHDLAALRLYDLDRHEPAWTTAAGLPIYLALFGRVEDTEGTLHVIRQPSPWSLTASTGERLADALASLLPGR